MIVKNALPKVTLEKSMQPVQKEVHRRQKIV